MTDRKDRQIQTNASANLKPGTPRIGRRGFFGASLGMAAAGIAGGGALPAHASETGDERTKARYQPDSEHVRDFYHVNQLVWPEGN